MPRPPIPYLRPCGSILLLVLCCLTPHSVFGAGDRIDFNFQIRPILSDRCFKCHGPDPKSRKVDLRLDTADAAFAICDKKTGARAIVPHKPDQSEIVRRITSGDPDEKMPPPNSNLQLSAEEITLMRKWIGQGAEYKQHWSFLPVGKIHPP